MVAGVASRPVTWGFIWLMFVLKIPILFVTAVGNRYVEKDLLDTGGDLLVPKPVDFTKLKLALANVHIRDAMKALKQA